MTSQSEETKIAATLSDHSTGRIGLIPRSISRLIFQCMDEREVIANADFVIKDIATDSSSKEVAALQEELRLQREQISEQIEVAQNRAVFETRCEWEEKLDAGLREGQMQIERTLDEFRLERTRYFVAAEGEVVKLALAIATRVLHREVKLDPLFLRDAVRLILEKAADQSTITIRVPLIDLERWQMGELARHHGTRFVGDERLRSGECVLDTSIGKIDLGVTAQLQEIEHGFSDLLQQRRA